jgi:hypothetical protein
MTEVSRAARAVLAAVTWKRYDVPPEGLPNFALEMAPLLAVALRTAALDLYSEEYVTCGGASYALMIEVDDLLAVAAELEDASTLAAELEALSDAD